MAIKNLGLLLVLSLLLTGARPPFGKTLREHPGLVSFSLRNDFAKDVGATLDKIKAMGITNMEMSSLFGKTAPEMRQLFDQRGMRCTSYGVSYADLTERMDMVVQNAKALGVEFVRLGSFPHQGAFDLAQAQQITATFNRIGKQLRDNGFTFVYHNHGFEFEPWQNGLTYFDYIVQNTDPASVSFEMDVVWIVLPGQDPVALLKRYPNRFKLMHIKDLRKGVTNNMTGGTAPENSVIVGTGQIDMPAVLKQARKGSVKYFYLEDESLTADQQIPQSLAFLKGV